MSDPEKYYGVHINQAATKTENEPVHVYTSYEEAHKVIKEHEYDARFKCCATFEEAKYFAINGSTSGLANPYIPPNCPYPALGRREIIELRDLIQKDCCEEVQKLVWQNPRYLISNGGTPTIMHVGSRYNALHYAAKFNRPKMVGIILEAVRNDSFFTCGDNLIDLYLNTPEKALNETPLHFASKYGSLEVIIELTTYPQLQLHVKNLYGETPKDIICKDVKSGNIKDLTEEIRKYLDEPYCVPLWTAEDEVVQPLIGKPYSPKSPPVCPLADSPLSPPMSIKAIAGPMNHSEAWNFLKTWKSPGKNVNIGNGTPHLSKGVLLRSPSNFGRGLETVGRSLAKKFHVSFQEYWPFLDQYADFSSEEGLKLLEKHLETRYRRILESYPTRPSSMSALCRDFKDGLDINSPDLSCTTNEEPPRNKRLKSRTLLSRRLLRFEENSSCGKNTAEVTDSSSKNDCNSTSNSTSTDVNICDDDPTNEDSEDGSIYGSAPNSLPNSDDEYHSADDEPVLSVEPFRYKVAGTWDYAVLSVLENVKIDVHQYPYIYLWKQSILHSHPPNNIEWSVSSP